MDRLTTLPYHDATGPEQQLSTEAEEKAMPQYSVRFRLVFGMVLLLVVALLPTIWQTSFSLRHDVSQDTEESARTLLTSVKFALTTQPPFKDLPSLDAWVKEYAAQTGIRLSYILGGKLVADSDIPHDKLDDAGPHGQRPEVLEAVQSGQAVRQRFSSSLGKEMIYATVFTGDIPGVPPGVLRLAVPESVATERIVHLQVGIWVALGASLLLGSILCLFISRLLMKSLDGLAQVAQAIGQGQYDLRMPDVAAKEFRPLSIAINCMARNIEEQLSSISEQNSRMEALLDGMREGVLLLDAEGKVETYNRAAEGLFPGLTDKAGYSLLEATAQAPLQDGLDHLRGPFYKPGHEPGQSAGNSLTVFLNPPDGRSLEATLLGFKHGDQRKFVVVVSDLTERARLDRLRRDFVANVSHELKTPLTSIRGYAELLLDQPDLEPEQHRRFLETIIRNARHLAVMAGSLMTLARAEHQGESLRLGSVDTVPCLRALAADLAPQLKNKKLSLELNLPESLPVLAESEALMELFRNLIDNACKYSPEGGLVRVEAMTSPTGNEAVFKITDQGAGIPEEYRDRIFERFFRLDREGDSSKRGSAGLGLAICRHLCASFGGSIHVEAASSGGAVFVVKLKKTNPGEQPGKLPVNLPDELSVEAPEE